MVRPAVRRESLRGHQRKSVVAEIDYAQVYRSQADRSSDSGAAQNDFQVTVD